ncbi:unnamed protein product, partial [Porites lobata]
HISVRELKATFFALKSFPKKQSHKTFCLSIGNTTAVSYVKNKGGPRSTCLHVPGKLNTVADSESRVLNDSREWKVDLWRLDPEVLLSDALTINWTTFMGYAFSPFHFILAVLSKVSWDQADIILHETPSNRPREPPKYTSNVSPITLSRVSHFRGQYQAMGLSNDVTEILLAAAHPSTQKTYKSAWG